MPAERQVSEPIFSIGNISSPEFSPPRFACDTHMHVFGPETLYPPARDAKYTLPQAFLTDYKALAAKLTLERVVLVQPSFYGTDNTCLLDALRSLGSFGKHARGVVFLPNPASQELLEEFHRRGVRGIRLDFFKAQASALPLTAILSILHKAAGLARDLGWHIELYSPGRVTRSILDELHALDVDFSIAHMGYMTAEEGLTDEDFQRFLELAASTHCWVKLTGPYRVVKDGSTDRADWMARELIRIAPDRVLWGTDWPHIPHCGLDTGALLNRLARWCPDKTRRDRILADNPARLYQF